jgi:hypothetical protein
MSYDFLLMKLDRPIVVGSDLDEAEPVALGTYVEVVDAISRVYPTVVWTHHELTGALDLDGRWFEFRIAPEPVATSVSVRTSFGQDSRDVVARLCDALGWAAFDAQATVMYRAVGTLPDGEARPGWTTFS